MLHNDYVKGHIPHTHNLTYYYELDIYMSRQWSSSIKCKLAEITAEVARLEEKRDQINEDEVV